MSETPFSVRARDRRGVCAICGEEVDPHSPLVLWHVEGWAKPRKRGLHGLRFADWNGQYMCARCVAKKTAGLPAEQGQLV